MRKWTGIAILVAVIVAGILVFERDGAHISGNKPIVRIGVTLPLTGDMAFAGTPARKAVEMAVEDMAKENDLKYDYELFFEDDQLDIKKGRLNASRLVLANNVNALASMWTISPSLTDFANENKVIHMGCSWGYATARGPYNFNQSTFPEEQSALLISEFRKRGISKIGIVQSKVQTMGDIITYLEPRLREAGIEIVFIEKFNPAEKDFRTAIEKMKDKEVDIVLEMLMAPGFHVFPRQMKETDYDVPMTAFDNFAYNPEYFEGLWFVADAEATARFAEAFQEQHGEGVQSCTANLYDSIRVLMEGFEAAPAKPGELPSNEDVAKAMHGLKGINSVMGEAYMDGEGNIHV